MIADSFRIGGPHLRCRQFFAIFDPYRQPSAFQQKNRNCRLQIAYGAFFKRQKAMILKKFADVGIPETPTPLESTNVGNGAPTTP